MQSLVLCLYSPGNYPFINYSINFFLVLNDSSKLLTH